jgi:hypothetical protein
MVLGSPLTVIVCCTLMVVYTRQSTRYTYFLSRLLVVPFLPTKKPPVLLGDVWRLSNCNACVSLLLILGTGVGASAALLAINGTKPALAATVTGTGVLVVVAEMVTVVVSISILVVPLYVAVTVEWSSVVKRVTLVMLRN